MSLKLGLPKINVSINKGSKAQAAPVLQADLDIHAGRAVDINLGRHVDVNVGRTVHADVDIQAGRSLDIKSGRSVDINVGRVVDVNVGRTVHADVDIKAGRSLDISTGKTVDINVGRTVHADVNINAGRSLDIKSGRSVDINVGRVVDVNVGRTVHADVDINARRAVDINLERAVLTDLDINATVYKNITFTSGWGRYKVPAQGFNINIFVGCDKLIGKDKDPVVLMYILAADQWKEVGRTEAQKNTANPTFTKPIEVEFCFGEVQRVRFDVYHVDSKSTTNVTDEDHLGFAETTLGEIITSASFKKQLILKNKTLDSTITLRAEDQNKEEQTIQMTFSGKNLERKDKFGHTDGFLKFSRIKTEEKWKCVLKTEVVKNNANPDWPLLRVTADHFCGSNNDAVIKVECYDWDMSGRNDLVGTFETSLGELIRYGPGKQWAAINPKKAAANKDYTNSGIITLTSFEITSRPTFLDYLRGGLTIGTTVAIDFTGSNGKITVPESLHYIGGSNPNRFMKAIRAVVGVMEQYDSGKLFPAYGFGARILPSKEVSHSFPLTFVNDKPNCTGVQGVLDAYKATLPQIELFGPTNFAPIVNHVAKFAAAIQQERSARNYIVLFVLTDGVISDLPDAIREIVAASHLPMSIVIVGIGGSDFGALKILDGEIFDTVGGVKSGRNIVQFVPYRDYETPAMLAKQLLSEIPRQVFEYYRINGIRPGASVQLIGL